MIDKLASIQHDIWSHWMNYMFTQGTNNDDGSFTIPSDKVERWKRQMITSYPLLTESEKSSDRQIVENFILSDEYLNAALRNSITRG